MTETKRIPLAYAATVTLTAAVFTIDLINPLAVAEWLGYILPLLVCSWVSRRRNVIALATVCTVLIILAFYLSPVHIETEGAVVSRCLGIVVVWVVAVLLMKRKQAEEEIRILNADLERRAAELATANLDLERLNHTLEERVREEVRQNREKDYLLIQQNRQAAMGETVSNIAHQWRQPLCALELFVRDLIACHESGEFGKEYLDSFTGKSLSAIHQMSETIDDFMNLLKPDKMKTPFKPQDAIHKALSFIEWGARRPVVACDREGNDDIVITGYPNEYAQVLLNIFNNARQVLAERRIASPRVDIRIFREGEKSVVTVTDNAGGIGEEVIDKVFDPYFTTKEELKGSGIGLYMSKMIIEKNMNGRLTVRNTVKGAEFRIEV